MSEFIATGTETTSYSSPIEPLQPQLSREKPQKVISGGQKLLVKAEKVNQLSEQLEEALFELKVTASEIKSDRYVPPIFKDKFLTVPWVQSKQPGLVVITTRKIDLFQQEREALQLSHRLRRRTKRRLKKPIPITLSKSSKFTGQNPSLRQQLVLTWQKLTLAIGRKPPTVRHRTPRVNSISY